MDQRALLAVEITTSLRLHVVFGPQAIPQR
jgi:hypothetical protein